MSGENDGAKEGTETCKEMVTNVIRTNLKLGKRKKKRKRRNAENERKGKGSRSNRLGQTIIGSEYLREYTGKVGGVVKSGMPETEIIRLYAVIG